MKEADERALALYMEAVNKTNEEKFIEAIELLRSAQEVAKGTQDLDLLQKIYNLSANTYGCLAEMTTGGEMLEAAQRWVEALQNERQVHRIKKDAESEAATILDICWAIEKTRPDATELEKHYMDAAELARQANNQNLLCASLRGIAGYHIHFARYLRKQAAVFKNYKESEQEIEVNFRTAIKNYQDALKIAVDCLFTDHHAFITGELANAYYLLGDFDTSQEFFLKRFQIAEQQKDQQAMRRVYGALGNLNRQMAKPTEAVKFYRLALAIAVELDDKKSMGLHCLSLGELRTEETQWEEGRKYLWKSIELNRGCGHLIGEMKAYKALANMYEILLDFEKAGYCYAVCRHLAKKTNDKDGITFAQERLYRLKEQRLQEVDGKLKLDPSDDPNPYQISLSTSLDSLLDSSFERPILPVITRSDDMMELLNKCAGLRMDDQRAEMPPPMGQVDLPKKRRFSIFRAASSFLRHTLRTPREKIRNFSLFDSQPSSKMSKSSLLSSPDRGRPLNFSSTSSSAEHSKKEESL